MDGLAVRSYEPGDEAAIVALFQAAYSDYGGYVPREEEYWKWSVLARPGVRPENIVLVTDEGEYAVAYGVLSGEGVVLEFAVTPDAPSQERRRMAAALLDALEQRARLAGLGTILAALPSTDQPVCEAAEAAGYLMNEDESLQFVVVDIVGLLAAILQEKVRELDALGGTAVVLEIKPGRCRFVSHDRILVRPGHPPTVQSIPPAAATQAVVVRIDLACLMDVIFARQAPELALISGAVQVRAEEHAQASVLLQAIVLSHPWYIPFADRR